MAATFSKLRDGSWGLRIEGALPAQGTYVEVCKRDGSRTKQCVGEVVLSQGDTHWCTIGSVKADAENAPVNLSAPSDLETGNRGKRSTPATESGWASYVAALPALRCGGCEDGCMGCDKSESAMRWSCDVHIPEELIERCRLEENGRLFTPEVGMGITYAINGDSYPYTIREVSPSGHKFVATQDRFVGKPEANNFYQEGARKGVFMPVDNGPKCVCVRKKNGTYQPKGQPYVLVYAGRQYKQDPSF